MCFNASSGDGPGAGPVARIMRMTIDTTTTPITAIAAGMDRVRFMAQQSVGIVPPLTPNLL